jgi:glycerol-3-phosphate dehydrogenase
LDGLASENLQQVYRYSDAQTDDAALTRAVLGSAQDLGARIDYPARFLGARRVEGGWRVGFEQAGRESAVRAKALINAAGPWVNRVLAQIEAAPAPLPVEWQGTHIVLEGALREGIYYVEAEDRRAVFVMPWQGQVLVGTTETIFSGEPDQAAPTEAEIAYLRRTAKKYFPWLGQARLIDAFAGLRVLPRAAGAPFGRPRETVLLTDARRQPTLLTIYGGKLTAARATAEQVMARLAASLPRAIPRADTRLRRLKPA